MIVKLLTEHHLEFLSLKGGCRGSSESYTCQKVKLLEISCHGLIIIHAFQCVFYLTCQLLERIWHRASGCPSLVWDI